MMGRNRIDGRLDMVEMSALGLPDTVGGLSTETFAASVVAILGLSALTWIVLSRSRGATPNDNGSTDADVGTGGAPASGSAPASSTSTLPETPVPDVSMATHDAPAEAPAEPAQAPSAPQTVAECRAAVPIEPGLKPTNAMLGGHMYSGQDPTLVAWLKRYLADKASAASGEAARGTLAFAALQGREGSTAAINTYDNQILTWGTGWGALGALPMVMDRLVAASPEAVARLASCGVQYGNAGKGSWAVDDGTGRIVTDKKAALQVIRETPSLLNLFIDLAKNPATREAVADAQLGAFLASSGQFAGSQEIATQALYNFTSHLKHWAPGYIAPPGKPSAVQTAAAQVGGSASESRDRQLAPAITEAFYSNAPSGSYVVSGWPQVKQYVKQMAQDGLDVTTDPVLSASSAPANAVV